jgi:hypothetical protein
MPAKMAPIETGSVELSEPALGGGEDQAGRSFRSLLMLRLSAGAHSRSVKPPPLPKPHRRSTAGAEAGHQQPGLKHLEMSREATFQGDWAAATAEQRKVLVDE